MKSCVVVLFLIFLLENIPIFGAEATTTTSDSFQSKDSQLQIAEKLLKIKSDEIAKLKNSIYLLKTKLNENQYLDTCPSFNQSSIYKIKIPGSEPFTVPCELTFTGWTVIQRRVDGSENFARNWTDYKNGFGDLSREFFIGLQKLHLMTSARPHELYIKLGKIDGSTSFAHYDDFKIGSEAESFKLISVGKYSGTAGDSLKSRESLKFSTFDRENDRSRDSCAVTHGGGWWYYACTYSMLNGKYYKDGRVESGKTYGIHWGSWQNDDWTISLTFAEMMIRPKA